MQRLAILGSTGSIGRQTLDVVRAFPDRFEATTLTAASNWELLVRQAAEFRPDSVVIARRELYGRVAEALEGLDVKVYAGEEAIEQVVRGEAVDTVVNALVGYAGLAPTLSAVEAGRKLALANKESLVVAGELVMRRAMERGAPIIPVDSEHSAIFQSLVGERSPIEKLILTASGGPFLRASAEDMARATIDDALRHPRWSMGARITVDSATMLNKGFEVIEARWLFGVEARRIEVVVHPQSIVHSLVEFADSALKAQLGTPDMHLPIQYALTFPDRLPIAGEKFSFVDHPSLTFERPDLERFPLLEVAYDVLARGGNAACILNAAGETAVEAFLAGRISFPRITEVITEVLARATFIPNPTVDDYRQSNSEAKNIAGQLSGFTSAF
jgi:1-deoxy-D-xylulose-5-phosphate reductoisomerase